MTITGTTGDGFRLDIDDAVGNSALNTIAIDNVTITSPVGDGIELNSTGAAFTDFAFTNSTITGSGSEALELNASGTRTRLLMENNSLTGAIADGTKRAESFNASRDCRRWVHELDPPFSVPT